ncbi:MAG TPA: flagellar motor stator protein MotA [Hypericibacter adhaerens]|jgi:chemotaxis protein MotA|uniref:Flagellar motor stator protein MotA n=1 Tax=Hypericibacter adhaerens TaxID=2602016 RepID=A0A5J6MXG9_9PROT|nr:flagellar motor stator protein MotA [Hypericibacter adhaerens]QEX21807.1 flagellar motor stator protein MotA [Hypericibacter adhaerens]HWA46186.1 flagellar motor stator protein MotA [Hypericibacter adhaerens]
MFLIIGSVVVIACVIGGYMASGGHLIVLFQPFEVLIIAGAATGAFIIANSPAVLKKTFASVLGLLKGPRYNKASYVELLSLLYQVFKLSKTKGMLALESHIEKPDESTLFQQFPNFAKDHHAMVFLCDYLRMLTLGTDNPHEVESVIDEELETHHKEQHVISDAVQTMADGMPALGIVAAVLGVIHTMGSITEPPEVLGHLIGGALVGTFMGVLLSYGFVAPTASALKSRFDAEAKYLQCIRAGLLAHMQGYPPAVSVEFARKALLSDVRPTFYEIEEAVQALPAV